MKVIDVLVASSLAINYSRVAYNVIRGRYKSVKGFCIDMIVSYCLAPLYTILILWDLNNKRKQRQIEATVKEKL